MPTKITFSPITIFSSSRPSYANQTFDGDLFEPKILSSMSHENFGSYFCYNLPNNSIYRVWFFFSKSVLNLVKCLKEIANGEYGITASFIGSIFTVSSYRISNNKPICTCSHQSSHFAPMLSFQGIKE